MRQTNMTTLLIAAVLAGSSMTQVIAQEEKTDPPTAPKSIDELLGLDEETDAPTIAPNTPSDPIDRQREEDLNDKLNERSISENFTRAINDMKTAADMLAERSDAGIRLQRLQEEIVRRLDAVIEQAQQQQQSSSSSSSQQQQQQQQQQVPQRPEQQQSQQQQQQQSQNGEGGEQSPPARQAGDLGSVLEESDVEWGALPERLRELIRQGLRESVSRTYRRLTEEYFRRIAEESSE